MLYMSLRKIADPHEGPRPAFIQQKFKPKQRTPILKISKFSGLLVKQVVDT